MRYTIDDILDVLSESTQDSIYNENQLLYTEGFIGVSASIFGALIIISKLCSLLSKNKTITLSGDKLKSYKKLIEVYAAENKLPQPKDFKCIISTHIKFNEFQKLKNKEKLINEYIHNMYLSKDEIEYIDKENFVYNTIIHGPSDFDILIYKNEIISCGDSDSFDMYSNIIDNKYAKLLHSYYNPVLNYRGHNELKILISFFKEKYPHEMNDINKIVNDFENKNK